MKILFGIFTILVLLFAGAIIAPSFIDWSQYKAQIEAQAEKATGYDFVFGGDIGASLIPAPRVYVENVTVKALEGVDVPHLAKLERLELGVALVPLLSKSVQITDVEAVSPDINVVINEQGKLAVLSPKLEEMTGKTQEGEPKAAAPQISLDKLSITDGRVSVFNLQKKSKVIVENITLDAAAESLSGPFTAEGSVRFDGKDVKFDADVGDIKTDDIKIALNAVLGADLVKLRYGGVVYLKDGLEAQGALNANVNNPAKLAKLLSAQSTLDYKDAVALEGLVSLKGQQFAIENLKLSTGENNVQGKLGGTLPKDKGAISLGGNLSSLKNMTGKRVISDFNVVIDGKVISFKDTNLTYGGVTADVSGRFNSAVPSLDVKAVMASFNSNDLVKGSAGASGASQGSVSSAPKNLKRILQEAAASISIPFDVTADVSVAQGVIADMPFKGLLLNAAAKKSGQVNISRLSINEIAGAQVSAQGRIGNVKALSGLDVSASVSAPNVQVAAQALKLDIRVLPSALKSLKLSLKAAGSLDKLNVTALAKALGGELSASGAVTDPFGSILANNLAVRVKHANMTQAVKSFNPSFQAPMPAFNRPLDFAANITLGDNVVDAKDIKATLLGSNMSGALKIKTGGARPDLSGSLNFGALDLGDANASGGSSKGKNFSSGSRWSNDPIDPSFLSAANFNVALKATSLKYAGWDLTSPVFNATLQNGLLSLSEVSAGLYDGRLSTSATIQSAGKALQIKAKPVIQNVSLEPLVTSLAKGKLIKGQGRVNMNADLSLLGGSQAALVKSLAGSGVVTGKAITLDGIDLTKFARAMSDDVKVGDSLASLWGGARSGGSTAFESLDGAFDIKSGVVNMSKMDLVGTKADIATRGNVDLPRWTLATKHTVTLKDPSDVPPFTMEFKGSLSNPAQTFGQGAVQDYLQRKLQRKLSKELQEGALGKKLQEEIGDKIGIPNLFGGGEVKTAPAANDNEPASEDTPAQTAPVRQENTPIQRIEPEQVIRGVLDGFLKQ